MPQKGVVSSGSNGAPVLNIPTDMLVYFLSFVFVLKSIVECWHVMALERKEWTDLDRLSFTGLILKLYSV